ncbi:hypothetical protein ACS016_12755 [Aeromonas veronii]|uniref:hypothetical protein n=2 Tax=Aeromonas veronii TaxID=654 RepID=UPI003D1F24BB
MQIVLSLLLEEDAMEWHAVSREWAQKIIAAGLHCELNSEGLRISAISECLRSVSYLCSAPTGGHDTWKPAASVRLTGMVRSRLAPLWPNLTGDDQELCPGVMDILNNLGELGDMVRFEGGHWLPAPAHAVRLGDGKAVLLGGGPMKILPHSIGISAKSAGPVRIVEQVSCTGFMELWEPVEWIGAPVEGLDKWSARLLAQAESHFTDASSEMNDSSVYLNRKWVNVSELPSSIRGSLLCKMHFKGGVGGYFIGEFVNGYLRRVSSIDSTDDVRRYRFHLDMQANQSINVHVYISQGLIEFKLNRRLPMKEAKVFLLGWQIPTSEGYNSGITHHVLPEEMLPIVRCAFEGLGIGLVEREDVRSKS